MPELQGSVALVTGAAGGIGTAVVRALAERGVIVAAVDRQRDHLEAVSAELRDEGLTVHSFPADVSDGTAVGLLVSEVEDRLGPIRLLVNGAGVLRPGEATSIGEQDWIDTFAVNTTGVFMVSRVVAGRMIPRRHGSIVTIASNAASTPRVRMAAYAASKAAASMFTKSLGLELAHYGIRCNVVAPGSTETPMLEALWREGGGRDATLAGDAKAFRVGIPLGKLAQASDIAHAVVFLLSEQADHITMQDLTVDGGATLGV